MSKRNPNKIIVRDHVFDDFLCATVVHNEHSAVRKKDLYQLHKDYYKQQGVSPLGWAEFHNQIEVRRGEDSRIENMVVIAGIAYITDDQYPTYLLPEKEAPAMGESNQGTQQAETVASIETSTPAAHDEPAPWE